GWVFRSRRSLLRSEVYLDRALRRADARTDRLPLGAIEVSVSQVAHATRAERADAGMADALATPEGQVEAALLAGHQDWGAAVRLGLGVAGEKADLAALAFLHEADLGLEALHVQALAVALPLPVVLHGIEHVGGTREERFALAPVGADVLEIGRGDASLLRGQLEVQAKPLPAPIKLLDR